MQFVQSGFLGALLPLLAIPIIVHLIFRMRTRRVDLGTIRFLKEVLQKNARRKQMKRFILLAMRMACVALLVFLFARPFFVSRDVGTSERFVAILIDRSASMDLNTDQGRLIELAVAQAKKIVQSIGGNTRIEVAMFDHAVRPLGEDGDVIDELVAPTSTFYATNYGAALAWARDVCVSAGAAQKELHVFTDLQRSGLDWSETESMPRDVGVHLHDLGRDAPNNVAVTGADLPRTLIRPGDTGTVNATVFNAGRFSLDEVAVVLHLENNGRSYNRREKIKLASGEDQAVEFEVPSLDPGLWKGHVSVETDDDLQFDNQRHIAVMAARAFKVLVVDGQPHKSDLLSETYFLEAALRLAPIGESYADSPYNPSVVKVDKISSLPNLNDTDLVILANVASVNQSDADKLAKFVEAGGGLVVFTGENVQGDGYDALDAVGLTPGTIVDIKQSNDLPWRVQNWDEKHSIFKPFNDPQHGDLRRIAFHSYTKFEPASDAKVLATLRGGDQLVVEREKGDGSVIWFASACDRQWSDWQHSRLYLPMVHQMLGYLTGLNEGGPVRSVLINASNELAADMTPGVYKRDRYWEVVNASPRESESDRCTNNEFVDRFDLRLHTDEKPREVQAAVTGPASFEVRDDEIWHWVVFALVGLLCAEFFLSNRTTA